MEREQLYKLLSFAKKLGLDSSDPENKIKIISAKIEALLSDDSDEPIRNPRAKNPIENEQAMAAKEASLHPKEQLQNAPTKNPAKEGEWNYVRFFIPAAVVKLMGAPEPDAPDAFGSDTDDTASSSITENINEASHFHQRGDQELKPVAPTSSAKTAFKRNF